MEIKEFLNIIKTIYTVQPIGFDMFKVKHSGGIATLSVIRLEDDEFPDEERIHASISQPTKI